MMLYRTALLGVAIVPGVLLAQPGDQLAKPVEPTLLCWPEPARSGLVELEKDLVGAFSAAKLREWHDLLASEPHVAGTPGDEREIERIAGAFKEMGLDVQTHEIWPLLCRQTAMALEIMTPDHVALGSREDGLKEDPYSSNPDLSPGWNAYSGSGDVTAEVVYANYGTKGDFEKLAELGVDVKGKIVLARYGGNYRGYKDHYAEKAGAAGLIIYTDPADSGYCKGLMYPEGGFANGTYIQRGSILALSYPGDPLTPGREATKDVKRLDLSVVPMPKIPVSPIGFAAAQEIIGRMKGAAVPAGWQGGLPFTYRVTGGSGLTVHLKVEQERYQGKTANVVALLAGATEPEKVVVIGCHHDAWGYGAADPLAGTICLMEAARVLSDAAKNGRRPARSIMFCAWGAEEFGIIGSTEWVEANREFLEKNGVGYINLDMAAMGPDFGCSATASMQRVIADVAKVVPQARDEKGGTVFDAWVARSKDAQDPSRPQFGDMGGGSDHEAFVCFAGVASAGMSAGGAPGTSYHSVYDDLHWYRQTVGDDYAPALMVSRMAALTARRLADAPLIPLDPARYGVEVGRAVDAIVKRSAERGWSLEKPEHRDAADAGAMLTYIRAHRVETVREKAVTAFGELGKRLEALRAALPPGGWGVAGAQEWNDLVLSADRAWIDENGLAGRPWFRNVLIAPDEDSGYASWPLPGLRRAVEEKDDEAVGEAVYQLEAALERVTGGE